MIIADRYKKTANKRIEAIKIGQKKADELRVRVRTPQTVMTHVNTNPVAPAPEPKPDSAKLGPTPQGAPTSEKKEIKGNPFAIKPTVWPKR